MKLARKVTLVGVGTSPAGVHSVDFDDHDGRSFRLTLANEDEARALAMLFYRTFTITLDVVDEPPADPLA